jgi:hypothetical protein
MTSLNVARSFTMNRQTFLHHYLPAHLLSSLVTGSTFHFILSETVNYPISIAGPTTRRRPKQVAEVPLVMRAASAVVILALVLGFWFLAPLTYGTPGLDPDAVNRRRLLSSWTLHWAYVTAPAVHVAALTPAQQVRRRPSHFRAAPPRRVGMPARAGAPWAHVYAVLRLCAPPAKRARRLAMSSRHPLVVACARLARPGPP